MGENTEFELANNSLDNLEVRLIRGTAIVEATGADDTPLLINITTPHAKIAIVRRGLYRLNVVPGDNTELIVRKGRVMHEPSHTKIKGGNKVVFSADTFSVAKLQSADKKNFDTLEVWSKERAGLMAEANRKMRSRDLTVIMASMNSGFSQSFFGSGRTGGFWFYNARVGCYSFMPYYYGWGSPYGGSYSSFYPLFACSTCFDNRRFDVYPTRYPSGSGHATGNVSGNPGNTTGPAPSTSAPSFEPRAIPSGAAERVQRHMERLLNSP